MVDSKETCENNNVQPEKRKKPRSGKKKKQRQRAKKTNEISNELSQAIKMFQRNPADGLREVIGLLKAFDLQHDKIKEEQCDWMTYNVRLTSNREPPFKIRAQIPLAPLALRGWDPREHVNAFIDRYKISFMIISLEKFENYANVIFVCTSADLKLFSMILNDYQGFLIPASIKLENRKDKKGDMGTQNFFDRLSFTIVKQMYDENITNEEKKLLLEPLCHPPIDTKVKIRQQYLKLTVDQVEAIEVAVSSKTCSVVQSSFGTGKTLIGALIAANASKTTKKPILLIAQTNSAVAQLARTIDSLEDYKHLNPVRIKAENMNSFSPILFDIYASTPIDILSLCKSSSYPDMSANDELAIRRFEAAYTQLEEYVKRALSPKKLSGNIISPEALADKVENLEKTVTNYYSYKNHAYRLIFKHRKPRVLCITVDKLLKSFKYLNAENAFLRDPEMIIIDESSQHPEYNFLQLLDMFPDTRFCLIGDDKQLTPYSSAPSESKITSIGRRSVLDILVKQASLGNCNQSKLLTTFRCHPSILELPNELFYSKTLISGCNAESKSFVLKSMKFPNPNNPMAFIDVKSTHYKSENSLSCGNDKERARCMELIKLLLQKKCVTAKNLAVVSFYAEQRMKLSEDLKKDEETKEVRVNTVDSIQGAEFDVVILLTTKTAFAKKEPFLTNPNRINVAITRAKLALFIMGRELTLRSLPIWRDLIAFCEKKAGIISEKDIPKLF